MEQFEYLNNEMEARNHLKNGACMIGHAIRRVFIRRMGVLNAIGLFITGLAGVLCMACESQKSGAEFNSCDAIKSETSSFTSLHLKVTEDRIAYNYAKAQVHYTNAPITANPIYDGIDWESKNFIAAEAEGKNPTLRFKDVPDEYLTNVLEKTHSYMLYYLFCNNSYIESSLAISNPNAKVAVIECITLSGSKTLVTDDGVTDTHIDNVGMDIEFKKKNEPNQWVALGNGVLVYSNTDCIITGEIDSYKGGMIDIRLKKGWNKVFSINCHETNTQKIITLGTDDVVFSPKAG